MWDIILQGRWFMIPLLTCSILGWGVIIERWITLSQLNIDITVLREKVLDLLKKNNPEKAITLCKSTANPVSDVMAVGLEK